MAVLRLFAQARDAAGTSRCQIDEPTVDAVLSAATAQFGPSFHDVLAICQVWVNGEPATNHQQVGESDEVAVLPPVSGGA